MQIIVVPTLNCATKHLFLFLGPTAPLDSAWGGIRSRIRRPRQHSQPSNNPLSVADFKVCPLAIKKKTTTNYNIQLRHSPLMDVWLVLLVFNLYLMAPLTLFYAMINCGNKTHTGFVFISSVNLWIAECCCDQSYTVYQINIIHSSYFFSSFGSFSNSIVFSNITRNRRIIIFWGFTVLLAYQHALASHRETPSKKISQRFYLNRWTTGHEWNLFVECWRGLFGGFCFT